MDWTNAIYNVITELKTSPSNGSLDKLKQELEVEQQIQKKAKK